MTIYMYSNPYAAGIKDDLPDTEIFEVRPGETVPQPYGGEGSCPGWYWWSRFPGFKPNDDPVGPFATVGEAIADVQLFHLSGATPRSNARP